MIDILIIGSGPAGYTAAIYSARAGYETTVITGVQQGGQLMITSDIENYPGFVQPISGSELMQSMKEQAERVGVKIICDSIINVNFTEKPFACFGESGTKYSSRNVIIATGANARWLNIVGEEEYRGKGVSACATCDGFFFKNKDVVVIGGGNTAVEEALFLTNFAKKITLIHRRNELRAEKIMQKRLMENPKIEIIWNTVVNEIYGQDNRVTGLIIQNVETNKIEKITTNGVFVAVGHKPATDIFRNQLNLSDDGYIIIDNSTQMTSVFGVFAAGDVADPVYKQAVTSAAQGCMAAINADKFFTTSDAK